jgi:sugar phosphate isomerase/epimerase
MQYNRRKFIKLTGGVATGLALGSIGGMSLFSSCDNGPEGIKSFGLQLYSLRDDMPKDPKGILKQVASFGYKQIESYQHDALGMFWGMTNLEFKKYMDDLGMSIVASHCDINQDFEKKAAEAAAIGMKYLICPYKGPQQSLDDFKRFATEFNQKGEVCKKNGIRFAYHNHDYSFKAIDGQLPQDVMMQNTDPALVDFEMDMYWVVTGGHDPITWIKKYPNRFRLCHVKDRMKGATETGASCTLGEGSIDYPTILKEAKSLGMDYFIVEQERYDGTTPLKAAEADAAYMKKLKV